MNRNVLILIFLTLSLQLKAQKVSNYSIYAEFFPQNVRIDGDPISSDAYMRANTKVIFSEKVKDSINFYLHGELVVDSVYSDNKKINFKSEQLFYDDEYSLIALKTTLKEPEIHGENELIIYYSGFMNPSRVRSLSDYMHINVNSGVYLRSYYYSLWFPVFIEPGADTYETDFEDVTVVMPANFKCVVGGDFYGETVCNNVLISRWKPGKMNLYDIQCTAREFQVIRSDNIYVYHINNKEASEKIINFSSDVKSIFAKYFRKTSSKMPTIIAEMPQYGLISSGNVVGLTTPIFTDFKNNSWSKTTLVHEMIHPYVHIPVVASNDFYALVMEGFPVFFPDYVFKKMYGEKHDLKAKMKWFEDDYLNKRKTGKTRWGELPKEKPILEISADEISEYKDVFVLNDRVRLFFYHIWNNMGDEKFDQFVKDLFKLETIDYDIFEKLVLKHIPSYKKDLNIWLNTTEFPEEFKIK